MKITAKEAVELRRATERGRKEFTKRMSSPGPTVPGCRQVVVHTPRTPRR